MSFVGVYCFHSLTSDICSKNHARAMDSMQASLESEQRAKAEALRIKKKLEGDINELEIALDHANKANSEAQKAIKHYQGQHRDEGKAFHLVFCRACDYLVCRKTIIKLENVMFSLIKTPYCNTNPPVTIYALLSNFQIS